jgi:hypothetical protein
MSAHLFRIDYHPDFKFGKIQNFFSVSIPSILSKSEAPLKESSAIYGFLAKSFYPIAILDKNGIAQRNGDRIQISVVWHTITGEHIASAPVLASPVSSGVYWFKAIQTYVLGTLSIIFSCPMNPMVAPFTKNVAIIPEGAHVESDIIIGDKIATGFSSYTNDHGLRLFLTNGQHWEIRDGIFLCDRDSSGRSIGTNNKLWPVRFCSVPEVQKYYEDNCPGLMTYPKDIGIHGDQFQPIVFSLAMCKM